MKNVIVGQSGGPTAVINASLAGVYSAAKQMGAEHVYGMVYGVSGLLEGKYIDLGDYLKSEIDIEILKRTPATFLGSCRNRLPGVDDASGVSIYENIFSFLKAHEIDTFIYIGGNDSMDTVDKLSKYGDKIGSDIRFIGAPKTIDNDLCVTDHTPGFGSAAKYVATVTKELARESNVYDNNYITILEIMGRNAGWLAAASALASGDDCEGASMILLPEVVFDENHFLEVLSEKAKHQKGIVIAVSEGIKTADGHYVCEMSKGNRAEDAFGHTMLDGTGRYLSGLIADKLTVKTRAIEMSTLQRCASHIASKCDVDDAFNSGFAAIKAAVNGESGKMVVLTRISDNPYSCATEVHNISDIANKEKKLPKHWILDDYEGLTNEFTTYCRPLIMGEVQPVFVNGLPRHIKR